MYARRTLLAGFTTVRNLGDSANESASLRNAINAGVVPGPRIFTAGKAIGSTGGHADPTNGYRQDLAKDLGAVDVELRVTLSYFIEPSAARRGWRRRYAYASHGLRFEAKGPSETVPELIRLAAKWNLSITLLSGSKQVRIGATFNLFFRPPSLGETGKCQSWNLRLWISSLRNRYRLPSPERSFVPMCRRLPIQKS